MFSKICLVISVGIFVSATAFAADTQVFSAQGDAVIAFFESTDATGCIITDAVVAAGAGSSHLIPGGPEQAEGIEVNLVQFNACTQII